MVWVKASAQFGQQLLHVRSRTLRLLTWLITAAALIAATARSQSVAKSPIEQNVAHGGDFKSRLQAAEPRPYIPELKCLTGTRKLDLRGDTRSAYEDVAAQFGVHVAFDLDLHFRAVHVQVDGVDCSTALDVLGAATNTFWRPLSGSLFFVAQNTAEKHKEFDISLVQTLVLPSSVSSDDMAEIYRTVRAITGVTRSDLNEASHSVTLRASPQALRVASELISNLEQPPGEVRIEIEALEIDRNAARDLGITPPESSKIFDLSSQEIQEAEQSYAGLVDVIDNLFGSTSIPPVVLFGGGISTFLAELPSATASFSEALSLIRQGRKVSLRVREGQPATFFVGDRIPVALSSYSAGPSPGSNNGNSSIPPITNYAAGNAPSFVTSASLRGNGINDLIVANSNDSTVSILLGNGDGTFQPQITYATGSEPLSIATGQFNETIDSYIDLAVANKQSNTVSILRGVGDGTFQRQTTLNAGRAPVSVVAANFHDLSSSTNVDLAVANQADNTISIFQGNGDGTFRPPTMVSLPVGFQPACLAAGDLNGDGHIDLVVANTGNNTFSVLLGNGDGTFRPRADYAAGNQPVYVALGDFNGDGADDIAVANEAGNSISIYYNQTSNSGEPLGTFVAGATRDFSAGNSPTSIAVADYNLDGTEDLAVSDLADNAVTVLLNGGNESFTPLSELPVGNGPVSITSADFNADGRPDLATADSAAAETTVILNSTSLFGSGGSPNSISPGVQYLDVGLKLKVTPRIHPDNSITLRLEFGLSSLTGESINQVPVISNESLVQTVRVQQDETIAIGGFLQSQASNAITGTPGLSAVPGISLLDRNESSQKATADLLILVTPRMLRRSLRKNDRVYAGKGSLSDGASEAQGAIESPPAQRFANPDQPRH